MRFMAEIRGYAKITASLCNFSVFVSDLSHLHGHLPGPGVWPGWFSVHNTRCNSRRNGWFATCTWPVYENGKKKNTTTQMTS